MVKRYPALLDSSPDTVSKNMQGLAQALGLDLQSPGNRAALTEAVGACPSWLGQLTETVKAKVSLVHSLLWNLYQAARDGSVDALQDERRGMAASELLLGFPGLLSVSSDKVLLFDFLMRAGLSNPRPSPSRTQLTSKFGRLARLAAADGAWGAELRNMGPKALGRCLAASHDVLDRLDYFHETGGTGVLQADCLCCFSRSCRHRTVGVIRAASIPAAAGDSVSLGIQGRFPRLPLLHTAAVSWRVTHRLSFNTFEHITSNNPREGISCQTRAVIA